MDYKDRGYKAELLGQEDVDGNKAYKIQLTSADNTATTYYIDPSSYMLIKFSAQEP